MLIAHVIVTFVIIFLAGMHYATWDLVDNKRGIYWSIGLGLFGLYQMIALIGMASKV